jgi:hypothetical protein
MTPGAVLGKEYEETDVDEYITVMSPNLLANQWNGMPSIN